MRTDEEIDMALANEFEKYLGAVAKEMIQPIRDEAERQKTEIDRLCTSVEGARERMTRMLDSHQEEFLVAKEELQATLESTERDMKITVASLRKVNEESGRQLHAELKLLPEVVQSDITAAALHLEKTVQARLVTAETKLAVTIKKSIFSKLDSVAERKVILTRIQALLLAVCILQAVMIAVVILR